MTKQPRKPRIVNITGKQSSSSLATGKKTAENSPRRPRSQSDLSQITRQPDMMIEQLVDQLDVPPSIPVNEGFSWVKLMLGALTGLFSLGLWLAIEQLISDLFERQAWLGWSAVILSGLAVLAAFAIALREIWGISRLNTIGRILKKAKDFHSSERPDNGNNLIRELESIYSNRADLASSRAAFEQQRSEIFDSEDLIVLFEKTYMKALDDEARKLVMQSARRVSVVTAISPRALVDIAYVLMENTRLIRRISQLYGGRPGALGFWKLTRNVLGHLAVTGTITAGDSLIQQIVGHGIAARLSAKLGEGVVNGLLTARIGLSAIDQARPLQFYSQPRPGISEYFTELTGSLTNSQK
jgi:putative membrane protein